MPKTDKTIENQEISKNSIVKLSRKAGIKSISECGIEKIRNIIDKKIISLSEGVATLYSVKNGKTFDKKCVVTYLETQGIKYVV